MDPVLVFVDYTLIYLTVVSASELYKYLLCFKMKSVIFY